MQGNFQEAGNGVLLHPTSRPQIPNVIFLFECEGALLSSLWFRIRMKAVTDVPATLSVTCDIDTPSASHDRPGFFFSHKHLHSRSGSSKIKRTMPFNLVVLSRSCLDQSSMHAGERKKDCNRQHGCDIQSRDGFGHRSRSFHILVEL